MRATPLLLLALTLPGAAAPSPRIELNGKTLEGVEVVRQNGATLVPLRGIFQALGAEVRFDAPARAIHAQRGQRSVDLVLDQTLAKIDGREVKLDTPPTSLKGVTYVPLRFVAEALGAGVAWDGPQQMVRITANLAAAPPKPPVPETPALDPDQFTPAVHLGRIMIGNQAGIVKVFGSNRQTVAYFRGIDDRSIARLDDQARSGIFTALKIDPQKLNQVTRQLTSDFSRLPHREVTALLGCIGSSPNLAPEEVESISHFLTRTCLTDLDVVTRRQALLALAVMRPPSPEVVDRVLNCYESSNNLWETFPIQQFFEYHSASIAKMSDYARIRQRVSAVSSLYTPYVLASLDAAVPGPRPKSMLGPAPGY